MLFNADNIIFMKTWPIFTTNVFLNKNNTPIPDFQKSTRPV